MARRRTVYKERSRLRAAILAFFGGVLGLHKFYLRDLGGGIFFIMLFVVSINILFFPVTVVLGIFDAMKLLMMPDSEFDRKYNRHLLKQNRTYRSNKRSKVVERPAKRVKNNPFKKSGIKKYKEFALEDAELDLKKALEVDNQDSDIYFNLACVNSLLEHKEDSFGYLAKAIQLGFKDLELIKSHDDLAYIRIQPEFEAFEKNGFSTYTKVKGTKAIESKKSKEEPNLTDDILLSQLNKLKELRDKGVLSEKDYVVESKKLLRRT